MFPLRDVKAARLIAERTEGKPKQKIDMNMGIDGSLYLSLLSDSELEARAIKLLAESPELLQESSLAEFGKNEMNRDRKRELILLLEERSKFDWEPSR
jgi:hypothetical protein